MNSLINADYLRSILEFNEFDGIFKYKNSIGRLRKGQIAGTKMRGGYIRIQINSKQYLAHRLAWLYVYGFWPEYTIDHINGEKSDNRISNLRDVPISLNVHNIYTARKNSLSKILGVDFDIKSKKWRAQICVNGKKLHLGLFDAAEDAKNAYIRAKIKYHKGILNERIG